MDKKTLFLIRKRCFHCPYLCDKNYGITFMWCKKKRRECQLPISQCYITDIVYCPYVPNPNSGTFLDRDKQFTIFY